MRTCHRTIWFLQKEHIRPGMFSSPRLIQPVLMRSRLSLATALEGNHRTFGLPRRQIGGVVVDCERRTTAPGGVCCLSQSVTVRVIHPRTVPHLVGYCVHESRNHPSITRGYSRIHCKYLPDEGSPESEELIDMHSMSLSGLLLLFRD